MKIINNIKSLAPNFVKIPIRKLYRNKDWYKNAVGGLWEEIGKLQFNYLVDKGLKPEHYLLDVGCGSLRGGIHFVSYLNRSHYFGIDTNSDLINAGKFELKKNNLINKNPTLTQMDNFDFVKLNQKFDCALAQSVFTHLPLNSIIRCISNIEKVLNEGGCFYATFFENRKGKHNLDKITHSCTDGSTITTHCDKDVFHYDFATFEWVCEGTGLKVKYIGDWEHPRNQKIIVFVKTSASNRG